MRIWKNLTLFLALVLIGSLALPDAAAVKRPLTPKLYGKQWRLEWTGSAPVVTADHLEVMADTTAANVYGVDPFYSLYRKKVSVGEENVFPGERVPEKACVSVTAGGDADGTSSIVYMNQSSTKNGTFLKTARATDTMVTDGATKVTEIRRIEFNPFLFWKGVVDPVSATDSVEITAVYIWPCDD